MTPTEQLRRTVVLRVVTAIIVLAFLFACSGIALVIIAAVNEADLERAVPAWLAGLIGTTVGTVGTILFNSKGSDGPQEVVASARQAAARHRGTEALTSGSGSSES